MAMRDVAVAAKQSADAAERELWFAAILLGAFDVYLTWYGLSIGLTEQSPFVAVAIEEVGFVMLPALKAVAIAFAFGVRRYVSHESRLAIPLGFILLWGVATGINTALIAYKTGVFP